MALHSSIIGGSTADRVLGCPASVQAVRSLPPTAVVTSDYAEEGTFAHELVARALRLINFTVRTSGAWTDANLSTLIGTKCYDREVTSEHLKEFIVPGLMQLAELEAQYGGNLKLMALEQGVIFPGVPGAYGTCDLIMVNDNNILICDWKFGAGVPVKAFYPAGDGYETVNPQLLFYACAALHTPKVKQWFRGPQGQRHIVLAIIQPRTTEPLTHTTVTRKEIRDFKKDVHDAVEAAFSHQPRRTRGEHCRWAPCKISCPLWTGPVLDLSALGVIPPQKTAIKGVTPYAEYLAAAKRLLDTAVMMKAEIDSQMHAYLSDGGTVPGWRLKAKQKQRKWVDKTTVANELMQLGFKQTDIFTQELVTFAAADATAKRLKVKIPEHLRVAPVSTETTLATTDDPAPVVEPAVLTETFRAALKQLQQEGSKT